MVTIVSEETAGGRLAGGLSSGQRCHSSDALNPLAEWRFSEQVENGTPSTSPPYWDTDDSDDDGGPKPPELYGKYTWKIEKFSQISKRELRSNAFEVGGYKWYILIYPTGCDVCNHLSLFLCVANHDKLLPGWSHFAQFTIAVVNKDPKKSKYSDTLHRFWKKEHDWGWKKFMELSKVSDGFVDSDTLTIKAQVQVIREKPDRPFRCLDCQYRRELVRVYLTNVEQICRRFVEERRGKLEKLLEDKARWSSFCAFWLGMDQTTRRRMSREKKDTILKVAVKHFFIEKEVTSTLVMDSLYSGLKALDSQSKNKKGKATLLEGEETPPPIIRIEKDMFVLVDDVLLLLEKAAMEPLPPKDDKGPQNRTKDGGSGEDFSIDSIERDERRLTELGRRTVEIFVLAHIFSNKIEVAYQEAVALRRQEELIREEEAAWLAESELKAKRGVGEKDKKSKKKQGKQKQNNRKAKDKLKDEKPAVTARDKQLRQNLSVEGKDLKEPEAVTEKDDALDDVSDVSDIAESAADLPQPDSEDRDGSPVNWDTDTSEIHPPAEASGSEVSSISTMHYGGVDKRSSSVMDDSSSTCSTDSAPSVVMNGSHRSNSFVSYKSKKSPARGKNQRGKGTFEEYRGPNEADSRQTESAEVNLVNDASRYRKVVVEANEFKGALTSLQDRTKWPELNSIKKEEELSLSQRKQNSKESVQSKSKEKNPVSPSSLKSPPRNTTPVTAAQPKPDLKTARPSDSVSPRKTSSNEQPQSDKASSSTISSSTSNTPKRVDSVTATVSKPTEKLPIQQSAGLSRPSSAPLIPATLSATPVTSTVQVGAPSAPPMPRSISATGSLGLDASVVTAPPYDPQSYRNSIAGNSFTSVSGGFTLPQAANSMLNNPSSFSQHPNSVPNLVLRSNPSHGAKSIGFAGISREEALHSQSWMDRPERQYLSMYHPMNNGPHGVFPPEFSVGTSGQVQSALADEFPHLDIINDLLADEQVLGRSYSDMDFSNIGYGSSRFNRQFTYPTNNNLSNEGTPGSSGRFDRSRRYPDDSFQQDYGPGSPYNSARDFIPQGNNSIPYANGNIDNLGPNQWQMLGPDLSLLGLRSSGVDGFSYNPSDFSNLTGGVNGYSMFRSSNGH